MLFVWSCGEQIRTDNAFIIATYDDVKDWDPATAFSLEAFERDAASVRVGERERENERERAILQ